MAQKNTPRSADLHPGPGFRIGPDFSRLEASLIQQFQNYEVPDISDLLNRLHALDPAITCLSRKSHRLCGSVCTVRVFPGDNLMVHKALDIAKPNDIIVVDAHGVHALNAVLGDIICTKAKHRGIAGFVIDGLIRDVNSSPRFASETNREEVIALFQEGKRFYQRIVEER